MTGVCKFCGQVVILPEGEDPENAWLYCRCPEAVRQAQIDIVIEDGRMAVESLCGEQASAQGLTPVPVTRRGRC